MIVFQEGEWGVVARILAVVAVAVLAVGCHGKPTVSANANAQAQQDMAQAQKLVQGCLSSGNVLTKAGRQSILNCIAPKGHKAAFEQCAQSKLAADGLLSKAQRAKYGQDLAVCVENNR